MRDNKGRFANGAVPYNPKIDRTGETRIMNNGLSATIIRYNNSSDIDVKFENGKIAYRKKYINFSKGAISFLLERLGETRTMTNGLKATIIAYRHCQNIDIQFDNGQISYCKSYGSFRRGEINCPLVVERLGDCAAITNVNIKNPFTFWVDIEDVPLALKHQWYSKDGYAVAGGSSNGRQKLHRLIMGVTDPDIEVDHRDGNPSNNRKSNLRICTHGENMCNQPIQKNNTSGYKGIFQDKRSKRWTSQIFVKNNKIHLGTYDTPETAALAYNEAAIKHYGEFAKLNEV